MLDVDELIPGLVASFAAPMNSSINRLMSSSLRMGTGW
jgi:hypothetical protein